MFSIPKLLLATLTLTTVLVSSQDCGPLGDHAVCQDGWCCSSYGWCGETPVHCDKDCLFAYSGWGSACKAPTPGGSTSTPQSTRTVTKTVIASPSPTKTAPAPSATIPEKDVCGHGHGGAKCTGVGEHGYFYRCCSEHGHCGPKNLAQDAALYCGKGCQSLFGNCDVSKPKPPKPTAKPVWNQWKGGVCGPIVNRHCMEGECCSGSNFCGKGEEYCGASNWCQWGFGKCW